MSAPRILAFAGSVRESSFNRRLLATPVAAARAAGATVELIELRDYPLPLFDQDQEARDGLPSNARLLKDLFKAHDAMLLACPEYNGSVTPLLKNTLDWVSRKDGEESGSVPYRNKWIGLVSASAGRWGGMRGMRHVREILTTLGCMVIPEQYNLSAADSAFDAEDQLTDERARRLASVVGSRLAEVVAHGWR